MLRVKTNLVLNKQFKDFLEDMREKTGTPLSRILELATIEKYKKEYDEFSKTYVEGDKDEKNY